MLAVEERIQGEDHVEVAKSRGLIMGVLGRLGKFDEALAMGERALGVLERELGAQDDVVAMHWQNMAIVLLQMGPSRGFEALEHAHKALEALSARLPPTDERVMKAQQLVMAAGMKAAGAAELTGGGDDEDLRRALAASSAEVGPVEFGPWFEPGWDRCRAHGPGGLTEMRTTHGGFRCDVGGETLAEGATTWSCRECNHDVCVECWEKGQETEAALALSLTPP